MKGGDRDHQPPTTVEDRREAARARAFALHTAFAKDVTDAEALAPQSLVGGCR